MGISKNNKNMVRIQKLNSRTYAEIGTFKHMGDAVYAWIFQGEGPDKVMLASKPFKTEAGARRWIAKQFAI